MSNQKIDSTLEIEIHFIEISDSRMKFVAHERFQYVLLNKFGKYSWYLFLNQKFKFGKRHLKVSNISMIVRRIKWYLSHS